MGSTEPLDRMLARMEDDDRRLFEGDPVGWVRAHYVFRIPDWLRHSDWFYRRLRAGDYGALLDATEKGWKQKRGRKPKADKPAILQAVADLRDRGLPLTGERGACGIVASAAGLDMKHVEKIWYGNPNLRK